MTKMTIEVIFVPVTDVDRAKDLATRYGSKGRLCDS